MRKLILDILVVNLVLGVAVLAFAPPSNAQYEIDEIIDATGDGGGNGLDCSFGVAVDSSLPSDEVSRKPGQLHPSHGQGGASCSA